MTKSRAQKIPKSVRFPFRTSASPPPAHTPPFPGKTAVDKAAANRFIKHAIAQVRDQRTPGELPGPSNTHIRFDADGNAPASPAVRSSIPVRVTSKMLARQEYEKKLAEEDGGDDDEADALEVFDGDDDTAESKEDKGADLDHGGGERLSSKAKGKARAVETDDTDAQAAGGKKRRRAAPDPFAGAFFCLLPPVPVLSFP